MTLARRHALFVAYCLAVAAVHAPVLIALLGYSQQEAMSASHLPLIPIVSAVVVFQTRQSVFTSARWAVPAGVAVGMLGMALRVWAEMSRDRLPHEAWLSFALLALVLIWIAGFVAFYGGHAFRAALFPLVFLCFMVPIPEGVMAAATAVLKAGSTTVVEALFSAAGTPFLREGFVFSLPSLVIEVADECSGIRSAIALMLTSMLGSHLYLKTFWKRALVVALVLPVTIFKNGIRIVALSLLSIHVDPGFIEGRLHHEGGIVFFVLALALMAPVFAVLARSEPLDRAHA
jgi:exosortase